MNQNIQNYRLSADQLDRELSQQNPLLLFDLRPKDQFESAHVKGSVHAVCNAQTKHTIMPKIPQNVKIVLISEPEDAARETAQVMRTFGLDAHYLEDGFYSWKGRTEKGQTGKTVTAEHLESTLDQMFLLDVRNKDEFAEYQIPGSVNIPLDELFDEKTLEKIPKDKTVVTVCPHGSRAMVASFALTRAGIDSQTLVGGLAGWNQILKPVTVSYEPKIIQVQKIGKGCLSHIVESNGEAIVIDPLYPFEKYSDIAKENRFKITKVFDTHQHADHVSAARDLAKKVNAELYLSKYEGYDYDANFVEDDTVIHFGKSKLKMIHTPGHTPGSLSYVVDEKYVFTGDILFVKSIGRPDLRDKVEEFTEQLYNTLHEKLLSLSDDTLVFPTHHGDSAETANGAFCTTIKEAKKLPWLDMPKQEFIRKVVAITRPRPINYRKIIAINRKGLELMHSEVSDLEMGPNRCAVDAS